MKWKLVNLFSLYGLSNIAYWWSRSLKRPVRCKPDNGAWAYIFCLLKGMYWERRALLEEKRRVLVYSPPPPPRLNCEKKVLPFFPPSCLSWYILHSCLSQKWSIYSVVLVNAECAMQRLVLFFLFGSVRCKSVTASPVLHSAKLKKKTTHKAVPHLRIVLYFSRQIKIFNKLCTF